MSSVSQIDDDEMSALESRFVEFALGGISEDVPIADPPSSLGERNIDASGRPPSSSRETTGAWEQRPAEFPSQFRDYRPFSGGFATAALQSQWSAAPPDRDGGWLRHSASPTTDSAPLAFPGPVLHGEEQDRAAPDLFARDSDGARESPSGNGASAQSRTTPSEFFPPQGESDWGQPPFDAGAESGHADTKSKAAPGQTGEKSGLSAAAEAFAAPAPRPSASAAPYATENGAKGARSTPRPEPQQPLSSAPAVTATQSMSVTAPPPPGQAHAAPMGHMYGGRHVIMPGPGGVPVLLDRLTGAIGHLPPGVGPVFPGSMRQQWPAPSAVPLGPGTQAGIQRQSSAPANLHGGQSAPVYGVPYAHGRWPQPPYAHAVDHAQQQPPQQKMQQQQQQQPRQQQQQQHPSLPRPSQMQMHPHQQQQQQHMQMHPHHPHFSQQPPVLVGHFGHAAGSSGPAVHVGPVQGRPAFGGHHDVGTSAPQPAFRAAAATQSASLHTGSGTPVGGLWAGSGRPAFSSAGLGGPGHDAGSGASWGGAGAGAGVASAPVASFGESDTAARESETRPRPRSRSIPATPAQARTGRSVAPYAEYPWVAPPPSGYSEAGDGRRTPTAAGTGSDEEPRGYLSPSDGPPPPAPGESAVHGEPLRASADARRAYIEVHFKRGRRHMFLHEPGPNDPAIETKDLVKVDADRGVDLGCVGRILTEAEYRRELADAGQPESRLRCKRLLRPATADECQRLTRKAVAEVEALRFCREKSRERSLLMKVLDAEYQFDNRKLTFYFEADRRIDFRDLVRDLFAVYRTRIWMQQMS